MRYELFLQLVEKISTYAGAYLRSWRVPANPGLYD
jgi:hypothetical protein